MDVNSLLKKSLTSFDHSYEATTSLYDNLSYSRDIGLCEYKPKVLSSGNIIKNYHYKMGKTQVIQMPEEVFEIPAYRLNPELYADKKPSGSKKASESSADSLSDKTANISSVISDVLNGSLEQDPEPIEKVTEAPSSPQNKQADNHDEENYVVPPLSELDDY
ncbi:MAG: hypothetical protein LBR68_03860 [Lachnoclostridium sp.]|nr:hypothetical protein [Lachnoclostridium sp.]